MTKNKAFTILKRLPGVIALQRGMVISDAEMYNCINGKYKNNPVLVIRHGIRGTQNVNETVDDDSESSLRNVSNIQQTDTAKLSPDADMMAVRFALRFTALSNAVSAIAPAKGNSKKAAQQQADDEAEMLRCGIDAFIARACKSQGIYEVARRFARNVFNGRWLWRNRVAAQYVKISAQSETIKVEQDALATSMIDFAGYTNSELTIGDIIVNQLRGDRSTSMVVTAMVQFCDSGAVEVFPSQNYIEKKPTGFARSLYRLGHPEPYNSLSGQRVMGHAAIRDQKISNALRTIDTWYPAFDDYGRPIPVEPKGANLETQRFFRAQKGTSAFDLMCRIGTLDPDSPDGMFMIASLIRGGVYSQS